MTVLFAGHELDSFTEVSGSNWDTLTTAGYFDPDFSRCAIKSNEPVSRSAGARIDIPVTPEGWVQFRLRNNNYIQSGAILTAYTADDASSLFDINSTSGTSGLFLTLRGKTSDTAQTNITPTVGLDSSKLNLITVHWKAVSGGMLLEIFRDGLLVATATISNAYLNGKSVGIIRINGSGLYSYSGYMYSEIVVADEDPRGWRIATLYPNAVGSASEWVGNYADVAAPGINDADFISSDTADKVQLMGLSNLSIAAQNMDVKAVTLSGRARKGSLGPQNLQGALRSGSTNYFTANLPNIGAEFNSLKQTVFHNNPISGVKFTVPEIQGLEAGFKSIT